MGFENFVKNTGEQPAKKPTTAGRVDFAAMAENANPELGKLEQELSQLVQKVAAINAQMSRGQYAGRLPDLSDAVAARDALKKRVEAHPDFGSRQQGFQKNFTGRDARVDKRN